MGIFEERTKNSQIGIFTILKDIAINTPFEDISFHIHTQGSQPFKVFLLALSLFS